MIGSGSRVKNLNPSLSTKEQQMRTYEARIRTADGNFTTTTIDARDMLHAKQLLETKFGAGKVTIVGEIR